MILKENYSIKLPEWPGVGPVDLSLLERLTA